MSNSDVDIGLVQQLDSARADIQFLSKNHAETLKGLHSEIKSLQQSNRELQFQLTFAKTNDELELKINQLEKENTKYKSKMNEMVSFFRAIFRVPSRGIFLMSFLESKNRSGERKA